MLFGMIWSAFLKEKNKKNKFEKSPEFEKIHFFWKKCFLRNKRAQKTVFLASDYIEMFRKQIEHKKTKIFV